jgi:hypothetical protein
MLASMLDGGAPHGMHYHWKSHRLPELSDEVIETLVGRVEAITSPFSLIGGWAVGGAVSRADADGTAVGERERKVGFEINVTAATHISRNRLLPPAVLTVFLSLPRIRRSHVAEADGNRIRLGALGFVVGP